MVKKIRQVEEGELQQQQLEYFNEMKADIISAVKNSINPSVKYLTISDACERLKVSRSTITRMIKNKDLIAMKAYKRVLIPEKSIEKLLTPINQ